MQKYILAFGLIVFATALVAQEKTVVIRVKQGYAVINKGIDHGVKVGDRFRIHPPSDSGKYGEVEVIRVLSSIAAIKLLGGAPGYSLSVGDVQEISESAIVDELLGAPKNVQNRRVSYARQDHELSEREKEEAQFNRKGFIIGGGIGAGALSMTASAGGLSTTEGRSVFQTDFKIGYAPSNTLEIYYSNKVAWWGESGVTLTQGLSSIAFSSYVNSQTATGIFITGGAGISVLEAPFEDLDSVSGFGLFGGVGYEFAKHWSVQTDLLYSNIRDSGVTLSSFGIRLLISVLAY